MNQMNIYKNLPSRESGVTLIEIMISLVIGIMLLLGTASMFMSNKRIYREQEYMGRLQENARFAIQKLYDDIRMSGYVGCSDDPGNVTNNVAGVAAGALNDFSNIIEGYEEGITANWEPSNSADVPANIVDGTDAITIRFLRGFSFPLLVDMSAETSVLQISELAGFQQNDIVAIQNCAGTDLFQITALATNAGMDELSHGTPGNATSSLSRTYQTNASLSRYQAKRFYIGTNAEGNPSLYDTGTELIEGVENMQILYGEDTSGDSVADEFRTAANVVNWSNITSVRIALLLQTVDEDENINANTSTYYLHGTAVVAPGDQRRRRVATTTVLIRNRDI